ncbi:MAG: hypothetical protein H7A21_10435 [Spirochaetales bacterium]|nr:hypothetical protein [Leptospiraceae bacterium]MCP5481839.1 hypothetical protein [Spirochaetales bacterium]
MWLRLGDDEILNLHHVTSLKKIGNSSIEIRYMNPQAGRTVRFTSPEDRDAAFERVMENLIKLRLAMD